MSYFLLILVILLLIFFHLIVLFFFLTVLFFHRIVLYFQFIVFFYFIVLVFFLTVLFIFLAVFSERRVRSYSSNSTLDWFVTGYCITHCNATSSWSVLFVDSSKYFQAFSSGLHYSSTSSTHRRIEKTGSLTKLEILVIYEPSISPFLEAFHSLYPYTQTMTSLLLYGDLYSDDEGVPVLLQQLSHLCPKLRNLALPTLHPLYMSLPHLPQHTLDTLDITLPLMKDDSTLGHHLKQYQSLKYLTLSRSRETE